MKTSIILIALIFLNILALTIEPFANFLEGINIWLLLGLEAVLVLGYYCNTIVRDVRKVSQPRNNFALLSKKKSA